MLPMGSFRTMALGLLVLGSVAFAKTGDKHVQTEDVIYGGFDIASGNLGKGTGGPSRKGETGLETIHGGFNLSTGNLGLNAGPPEIFDVTEETPKVELTTVKSTKARNDKPSNFTTLRRGEYTVLPNFVAMTKKFSGLESVTFATQSDFTFLDNLEVLMKRWLAPISIAIYAPGTDFQSTLDSIRYLRSCSIPLISELVSFHLYFPIDHAPEKISESRDKFFSEPYDCSMDPPWKTIPRAETYKNKNSLIYLVNVGRNIAKEMATTHYILVADIELYPCENLASDFLAMITKNDDPKLSTTNRRVFVIPPFEIVKDSKVPCNKTELVKMLKQKKAFPFHQEICSPCHAISGLPLWKSEAQTNTLGVFRTVKRIGPFASWEPVYIGTADDPIYDERVSWDGQSDKRIQGWILCALDYDFMILNNAFVVHRPGVTKFNNHGNLRREALIDKTNKLIRNVIVPEYRKKYGIHSECSV